MAGPAHASLTVFQQFVANVGVSTDGFGSTGQVGTISASVPAGSTVITALLYSAKFRNNTTPTGVTFDGNAVSYTPLGINAASCCALQAFRADVTSIVAAKVALGPGTLYNFAINEGGDANIDGEALVVAFTNPALPTSTLGILDGFSAVGGDTTSINFATPLDPSAPGFFAEMRIGDSFSCCDQTSTIKVNGTTITNNAGNNDDGDAVADGALITVGGFDDPFSPLLPSYAADHERYNLAGQITTGNTSIVIDTNNPSFNDNIFLAVFHVTGIGGVNQAPPPNGQVPGPSTLLCLAVAGLAGAAWKRRRK